MNRPPIPTSSLLPLAAACLFVASHLLRGEEGKEPQQHQRIEVAENALPFSREITLETGKAAILVLPNGKHLAIWGEALPPFLQGITGGKLGMSYGERPFEELESEEIPLPDGGHTLGEYLSYIRQGSVMDRGAGMPKEYILFVDPYRISLDQREIKASIRLVAKVTRATAAEKVSPKEEVDYYVGRLARGNPKSRLKAIRELEMLLSAGSSYAGPRRDFIVAQLQPLKRDPDPQIRRQAGDSLREIGDAESILEAIEPEPAARFLDPKKARELGRCTKWCKDPAGKGAICRRVKPWFESDRAELRAFAVGFFSFTDPVPGARQALIRARTDPSPAVREAAAVAIDLVHEDDKEARRHALAMLDDEVPEVVVTVLEWSALCSQERLLGLAAIRPHLEGGHKKVRLAAIFALQLEETPEVQHLLLELTRDPDPDVRAGAAESLAGARSKAVRGRMLELLEDKHARVRLRAVQALRSGGFTGAVPGIEAMLKTETDPDVIRNAKDAINRLKRSW